MPGSPSGQWLEAVTLPFSRTFYGGSNPSPGTKIYYAALAQLVERNLAMVEVTSSNLVCRLLPVSQVR